MGHGADSLLIASWLRRIDRRIAYANSVVKERCASAREKVMLSLTNFAAEMEREKARQRTRDAMHRKAARGHVAGGTVYDYRNVRQSDHVERAIDPTEAGMVRRIFDEVASGLGFARVARGLNAEGIPGPRRRPHRFRTMVLRRWCWS